VTDAASPKCANRLAHAAPVSSMWRYRGVLMSNVCQVTGRKPSFGNNVSHSQRKTRRRWDVNIQTQRFWVPSEKRWVKLKVSAKGLKTINKHGIDRVLADMRRKGVKV